MTGERRLLLDATVPAPVAFLLLRDFPAAVRHLEATGQRLAAAGQRDRGGQILRAVAHLREAARQWREANPVRMPVEPVAAQGEPPWVGVSTAEAAELLKISERQVTNLITGGPLDARMVKGRWVIDELSVRDEAERRNSA